MILGWVIIFAFLVFSIFIDSDKILEIVSDSEGLIINTQRALISVLIYGLISSGFWIYIIRLARNLMDNLREGPLFTRFQVASLKLIGKFLILITIIDTIANFIFEMIFNNQLQIKFEFSTFLLVISIGLFMIFLSNIFEKAKSYKEENELTV
ncbi:DUF2975 domain-containing protein [Christiangramia fulva]|nr:DUF2975 domain-containing protein [Christiangramia fulva]